MYNTHPTTLLLFGVGRLQCSCCNAIIVNTSPNTTRPLPPPWRSSTTASEADRCCLAVVDCHAEMRCFRDAHTDPNEGGLTLTDLAMLARFFFYRLWHHGWRDVIWKWRHCLAVCKKFWVIHFFSSCGRVNSICRLGKIVTSGKS